MVICSWDLFDSSIALYGSKAEANAPPKLRRGGSHLCTLSLCSLSQILTRSPARSRRVTADCRSFCENNPEISLVIFDITGLPSSRHVAGRQYPSNHGEIWPRFPPTAAVLSSIYFELWQDLGHLTTDQPRHVRRLTGMVNGSETGHVQIRIKRPHSGLISSVGPHLLMVTRTSGFRPPAEP